MIIGDEHTAVIGAAGNLPDELKPAELLITPAAYRRLRHAARERPDAGRAGRGQISGRLMELAPDVRVAVLDAASPVFRVIPEELLGLLVERARREAASAGVHLNQLAAEYVAAAITYSATVWFGHDRNVPRPLSEGLVPQEVRWRLLSELRRE